LIRICHHHTSSKLINEEIDTCRETKRKYHREREREREREIRDVYHVTIKGSPVPA